MMKNKFIWAVLLIFICNWSQAQKQLVDKVIAVVGEEPLYKSELENTIAYFESQGQAIDATTYCLLVEKSLTDKLLINQADIDSIIVSEEEVSSQVDGRIQQIIAAMGGEKSRFEEYYGKSINDVRSEMKSQMKDQLLLQRMQASLSQNTSVTPDEVKEFYATYQSELPYYNAEVEVGELVVFPSASELPKKAALELINEIRDQIILGTATFEEMAALHSEDPGSKNKGGDLGYADRGTYVPEFEGAAYNLENGEYSEIVETEFGFHFMQLLDRKGNKIRIRHILVSPKLSIEDEEKAKKEIAVIRQDIVDKKITFREAVIEHSSDEVESKLSAGYLFNEKTGKTRFEVGDLDFEVFFAIDSMKVGDISGVMEFTTPRGKKGYKILQLISRVDAHKASLESDYYKIKELTLKNKQDQYQASWVAETVENSYLYVDSEYLQCPNIANWSAIAKQNTAYQD